MERWLSLCVGGIAGTAARYLLASSLNRLLGMDFPYGTLAVNLSGCFLVGVFDAMAETRLLLGPSARLMLITGFCGAYTTFSALIVETSVLLRDGHAARALLNFLGSGVAGLALFRAGVLLAAGV